MSIIPSFISLIDEYNEPLLVYVLEGKEEVNKVLKYNVFSNISLDYFESQLFEWTSLESSPAVKLFFQLEGVAVFGSLIKPTGLKIVIGFEQEEENADELNDNDIEQIFIEVKKIYLRVKLNPFFSSPKSDNQREDFISKLTEKFNELFLK